jgi:hypothetical protein
MPALTPSAAGPHHGPAKLLRIVRHRAARWFRPPVRATQPHPMPQAPAVPLPQISASPRGTDAREQRPTT